MAAPTVVIAVVSTGAVSRMAPHGAFYYLDIGYRPSALVDSTAATSSVGSSASYSDYYGRAFDSAGGRVGAVAGGRTLATAGGMPL